MRSTARQADEQASYGISRRGVLQGMIAAGLYGVCHRSVRAAAAPALAYLPGHVVDSTGVPIPSSQRVPFGWAAGAVGRPTDGSLSLSFPQAGRSDQPVRLRFSTAIEMREKALICATLPTTGKPVGVFDVRFVPPFQPHEISLSADDAVAIRNAGVRLSLVQGENPLWIFIGSGDGPTIDPALLPHLLFIDESDPYTQYFHRMASLASVQAFSWMEGCVLDGLLDLAELGTYRHMRSAAEQHLQLFLVDDRLVYEDPRCHPADNRIYGIEGTLPFAAIALLYPHHPSVEMAVKFWQGRRDEQGCVIDGNTTTSEGAYTVAYPMACIARLRQSDELATQALTQLKVRQDRLFTGTQFDRTFKPGGQQRHAAWCRGVAWEMIGMARTLRVLKDHPQSETLVASFAELSHWALESQRDDGLWSVYVKRSELTPDTAGSAGIAAALAIGHQQGWLDASAEQAARRALAGLKTHLTPDGFLGGASQSNKGGSALQSGSYRVIYQMAMGLMAQLVAALSA